MYRIAKWGRIRINRKAPCRDPKEQPAERRRPAAPTGSVGTHGGTKRTIITVTCDARHASSGQAQREGCCRHHPHCHSSWLARAVSGLSAHRSSRCPSVPLAANPCSSSLISMTCRANLVAEIGVARTAPAPARVAETTRNVARSSKLGAVRACQGRLHPSACRLPHPPHPTDPRLVEALSRHRSRDRGGQCR